MQMPQAPSRIQHPEAAAAASGQQANQAVPPPSQQGSRSWLPGGPRRSGATLAATASASAAAEERKSTDAAPSDAWALLGEDGPLNVDDQSQAAAPLDSPQKAGAKQRSKQARVPTPPRNLFEIAGLTGNMRGQGYELLLAEGIVGSAAAGGGDQGGQDEDSRPTDGAAEASGDAGGGKGAGLKINTHSHRVASSSDLLQVRSSRVLRLPLQSNPPSFRPPLQPGSPFMRGVAGDAYYDGEDASPRASSSPRRTPLVRHFSLSEADLLANTLMPPEQQAKVQAQTILSYMTILERRVQQLAAEFDTVVVTSRGKSSQFGVRGPRVEHDKDRHTFHVEVRLWSNQICCCCCCCCCFVLPVTPTDWCLAWCSLRRSKSLWKSSTRPSSTRSSSRPTRCW
jgi:hypothetical protein